MPRRSARMASTAFLALSVLTSNLTGPRAYLPTRDAGDATHRLDPTCASRRSLIPILLLTNYGSALHDPRRFPEINQVEE